LEHLHWYEFFTEMSGFRVTLALHDTYVPTSEPSTVALVRTLMADDSPISERTPDPSRVIRFPHHLGWFETDPATGIAVQKGIEDLLGTAEERALCHRQLLDAGKPIKQLYHRMFLLNETASAHDLKAPRFLYCAANIASFAFQSRTVLLRVRCDALKDCPGAPF
jgi:hypothetical protein